MPIRIQRSRKKGWKKPLNTIYVGRGSKFGNPYIVGQKPDTRFFTNVDFKIYRNKILTNKEAVYLFEKYISYSMHNFMPYLKGKNLMCWCNMDKPCHADILLKIANEYR